MSYLCDTAAGTLTRYAGYSIATSHTSRDSAAELISAGATDTLVADQVSACSIAYAPGTSQRAGLVTLQLSIADAGESISLLHQVHVNNVP